jgi:hypothetical protein
LSPWSLASRSLTRLTRRIGRLLRGLLGFCRSRGLCGLSLGKEDKPASTPLHLGTFSGKCTVDEVFEGDLSIDNISGNCEVTLESRHGGIAIKHSIEQGARVTLRAAGAVSIGEGIRRQSSVQIVAGGDVTIGRLSENSRVTVKSTAAKIEIGSRLENYGEANLTAVTVHIGQDIDQYSKAIITAQGDVWIGGSIDQYSSADIISLRGAISIGRIIQNSAVAVLTAGEEVHIGGGIDQHSQVTIRARSGVAIGHKVDHHSTAEVTSLRGSISVGQLTGEASATLIAPNGSINIDAAVDRGSTVNYEALSFNCPSVQGIVKQKIA